MGLFSGETRRFDKELKIVPDIEICEGGGGGRRERMLSCCPRCQAAFPGCPPEPSSSPLSSPSPSPSAPLSFVLPTGPAPPPPHPETELSRLKSTKARLRLSGWYHEGLTWRESVVLLSSARPGTFLVRDSSDPRFIFSLSVQTDKGPTSIRLHYVHGCFRLAADSALVAAMPLFDCVVALVEYYVSLTRDPRGMRSDGKEQVWVDGNGSVYSDMYLCRPLYRRGWFPSLQHLSRMAVNGMPPPVDAASLPVTLRSYLREYPYTR